MISAQTLHLTEAACSEHLPLFWRLGVLASGLPLLWPMTYRQALVINCQAKTHGMAYRLLENNLLALWRHNRRKQLHLTLYEYSLRACFPCLQQLPADQLTVIQHKKRFKDYLGDLQQQAHERQVVLMKHGVDSWYDYIVRYPDAEPLHMVVVSQLWPDIELLVELNDLCQYGARLGIVPIIIVSQRYFAKQPVDDWQSNQKEILAEMMASALVLNLPQDDELQIQHAQLQEIADLYHFFQPRVESHAPALYQDCLASIKQE